MANLPEKNITLVDKITSIPSNSNLFLNADGEFRQASVNDVVNSSTVVSTAVETAINTAVQDSIDSNFKQTSGSPILLTDSADGVLIDFKAYGRSEQKQYSGKNLLENTATTTSLNGGTFTVNEDGSVNVKGAFTDVTEFSIGIYNATENSILSGCPSGGSENTYQLRSSGIGADYGGGLGITAGSNTSIYIRVMSGQTIDITFKPMIRLASITDTTYEPYVGGVASPNPNYPQAIKSVADSGYFDGELLQGDYSLSTGAFQSKNGYVSGKNSIPCSNGDIVKITLDSPMYIYIYYHNDNGYVSNEYKTNVTQAEFTIPNGITNFKLCIGNGSTTIANAPHICVTINDTYALKVKSVGKNLLNINESDKDTTFFSYTKYTNEIVKATAAKTSVGEFICSFSAYLEKGKTYTFSYESINGMPQVYIYYDKLWGNRVSFFNISYTPNYTHNVDSGIYIIGYFGAITSGTEYSVVKPMLRRAEVTDDTYEPHKEEVSYIPLSAPLRSSLYGSVTDVASLGKCEVTRRIIKKRITQVSKNNSTNANNYCYYATLENVGKSGVGLSNTLSGVSLSEVTSDGTDNIGMYVTSLYDGVVYINVGKHLTENTVEGMTKWLSENPTYIQYELAEPIVETIEPVDIVTYDNVTYITASDNAEMEIEYPTTKVAGIASIGYSKGIKAEYETEQLKKQLLEIQATIVNTL